MRASDFRAKARENLAGSWGISILAAFIAAIFGALLSASGSFNFEFNQDTIQNIPEFVLVILACFGIVAGTLSLIQFILGGTVQLGYVKFLLKQYHHAQPEIKDLFSEFDRFGQGFLQYFLRNLYILLWALLFVIPGIIKSYSYSMTPFIMEDNPNMAANEAITASRELMDGHKWDLFVLDLSFIGWGLLNILTLGIGSFWLNPYKNASYAAFYRHLIAERNGII